MRAVLQRVSQANVSIDNKLVANIATGLLLLLGIEDGDSQTDIDKLSAKIVQLRIFADDAGLMNKSVKDVAGEILLVSQFTLYADTRKGNRPSFIQASKPAIAIPIYEKMIMQLEKDLGKKIQTGMFGADMQVSLVNDGPVTIIVDTRN